jgi:hypothetical protein
MLKNEEHFCLEVCDGEKNWYCVLFSEFVSANRE